MGATKCNQAVIFDQLLDSNPLFLTGNTDTVYCMRHSSIWRPTGRPSSRFRPGCGPGTVNDAFFRFVIDMGGPGPDRGKGGKYLIVPAGYKGELPKDKKDGGEYFVARSPSYVNWLILRGFLVDGKPDAASKMFREGVKVYPLSKAGNPPTMEFINGSKVPFNTIHANDFEFYEELDHVIQKEPLDFIDPELRGLAAAIGIRKGKQFAPDERMKKILTDAVAVGNATARAISFRNRDPRARRSTRTASGRPCFVGGDYRWLDGDGMAGRNLDARTIFFYIATVNTPAMAAKMVGQGLAVRDRLRRQGRQPVRRREDLQAQHPGERPREGLLVGRALRPADALRAADHQPFPSKNNKRDKLIVNADGSVDLYFGPKAPAGKEANWIADRPRQGLVRALPPLRPARAVVRQDLAAGRDRRGEVVTQSRPGLEHDSAALRAAAWRRR